MDGETEISSKAVERPQEKKVRSGEDVAKGNPAVELLLHRRLLGFDLPGHPGELT
jgi:hypothetical protein